MTWQAMDHREWGHCIVDTDDIVTDYLVPKGTEPKTHPRIIAYRLDKKVRDRILKLDAATRQPAEFAAAKLQQAARGIHREFLTDQKPGESLEAYNARYEQARNHLVAQAYTFCQANNCPHSRPNGSNAGKTCLTVGCFTRWRGHGEGCDHVEIPCSVCKEVPAQ